MPRRFCLVDVFSAAPFLGNPVAVVLDAQGLSDEQMMRVTRWMNLSETTFLLAPGDSAADYRVRIFTLERELPFAGHPTLGSCHAWLGAGGEPANREEIVQECGAGLVKVRRPAGRLAFAAPPTIRSGAVDDAKLAEIVAVTGLDRSQIVDAAWVDNGPGWVAVLLESAEAVLAVNPLSSFPRRVEIGLVGPHRGGAECAYEVRALFSDHRGGIIEDPVTGSLNASVAQWLLGAGIVQAPFVAAQGSALGREGRIHVARDTTGQVWIGGDTTTIVSGEIDI